MPKPMRPEIQTQVMPEPALEKRSRRSFTTEYKLKILSQADQCARGELGALLRKEKLYSNQLQQWRREFAERGIAGLAKTAPGPQARLTPEQREVERRNVSLLIHHALDRHDAVGDLARRLRRDFPRQSLPLAKTIEPID